MSILIQHPRVVTPLRNEVHFFADGLRPNERNFERGVLWNRSFFPMQHTLGSQSITGEASPLYLFHPLSPGADADALQELNNLSRITLDDGRTEQNPDPAIHPNGSEFTLDNRFRGGDKVQNATGAIDERFGLYRIQPTQGADYTPMKPRPETPEVVGGSLRVASFNVLNYFNGDGQGGGFPTSRGARDVDEFQRQHVKIVSAHVDLDADVVGLIEIENDGGPYQAVETLLNGSDDLGVQGLNDRLGAGTFAYIDTGIIGGDAITIANWLAGDPTKSGDPDSLIIGDLNAYAMEDPITALEDAGYTNLMKQYQGEFAYSYVFDGQFGYLDHALASPSLLSQIQGATAWHINADEPDILDYLTRYKKDAQDALFEENAFRSSDHDPVLVGIDPGLDCTKARAKPDVLWRANWRFNPVHIGGVMAPSGERVQIAVDSVNQDEPVSYFPRFAAPDARSIGTSVAQLRAQRSWLSDGRVYHVYFTASVGANSCQGKVLVSVPNLWHDFPAVDGGPLYDSTDPYAGMSAASLDAESDVSPDEPVMGEETILPFIVR